MFIKSLASLVLLYSASESVNMSIVVLCTVVRLCDGIVFWGHRRWIVLWPLVAVLGQQDEDHHGCGADDSTQGEHLEQ